AGLARREEHRIDRSRERRPGRRRRLPALLFCPRSARFSASLLRRLAGDRFRRRRRSGRLLLETELVEDVGALLLLLALRTGAARQRGETQREQQSHVAVATAHRRGTSRRWSPGWRTPSGRRDSDRRTSPRSSPGA